MAYWRVKVAKKHGECSVQQKNENEKAQVIHYHTENHVSHGEKVST